MEDWMGEHTNTISDYVAMAIVVIPIAIFVALLALFILLTPLGHITLAGFIFGYLVERR